MNTCFAYIGHLAYTTFAFEKIFESIAQISGLTAKALSRKYLTNTLVNSLAK
jgi:hypothetical protein